MTAFDIRGPLPTGTIVLQASAGTGKTAAIAGLFARFVAEGVASLPQIMAATFSGASTRELRSRIRDQLVSCASALSARAAGGPDAVEVTDPVADLVSLVSEPELSTRLARVEAALSGFDAATICTTHQFCDRMLAELGVLVDHERSTVLVDDLTSMLEEEVGLDPGQVEVLGTLNRYQTGTGFTITPVVGLVTPPLDLKLDDFEVADVFEPPLSFLLDPANFRRDRVEARGAVHEYWAVPWQERYIWGATAGMLVNLRRCLLGDE